MEPDKLPVGNVALSVYHTPGPGAVQVPDLDPLPALVAIINGAQHTLDFAIYTFAASAVGDAFIAAHARGVVIRGVADNTEWVAKNSQDSRLIAAGVDVVRDLKQHRIMHLKVVVADDSTVGWGSYNWTSTAEHYNDEIFTVATNASVLAGVCSAQIVQARLQV